MSKKKEYIVKIKFIDYLMNKEPKECDCDRYFSKCEYDKYLKKCFPVQSLCGDLLWLDDNDFVHRGNNEPAIICPNGRYIYYVHGRRHRSNGPALENPFMKEDFFKDYYYEGIYFHSKEEWEKKIVKKIIFSAQKIKTLKKLLYIPEIFQNVYYDNKKHFISLIHKM